MNFNLAARTKCVNQSPKPRGTWLASTDALPCGMWPFLYTLLYLGDRAGRGCFSGCNWIKNDLWQSWDKTFAGKLNGCERCARRMFTRTKNNLLSILSIYIQTTQDCHKQPLLFLNIKLKLYCVGAETEMSSSFSYEYDPIMIARGEGGENKTYGTAAWERNRARIKDLLRITSKIFLLLMLSLLIIFFFGIRSERSKVEHAKSTHSNYLSSSVCASNNDTNNFVTFDSKQEAISNGSLDTIVHCGDCGFCSTHIDIDLMIATKDTLTKDATQCALKGLVLGEDKVDDCLQNIGFTPGCSVSLYSAMFSMHSIQFILHIWYVQCLTSKISLTPLRVYPRRKQNNLDLLEEEYQVYYFALQIYMSQSQTICHAKQHWRWNEWKLQT